MEQVEKYYPEIGDGKLSKLSDFKDLLLDWNGKINLISRKDVLNFDTNHLLHSISISKFFNFNSEESILDVGTGGGLPGIPLAILFPEVSFTLIDSIGKKIMVVKDIANRLELKNVSAKQIRVEEYNAQFDYVIARAVTAFPDFVNLCQKRIKKTNRTNGIIYLKGGDFSEELTKFQGKMRLFELKEIYKEAFFDTKKIIYLPL